MKLCSLHKMSKQLTKCDGVNNNFMREAELVDAEHDDGQEYCNAEKYKGKFRKLLL